MNLRKIWLIAYIYINSSLSLVEKYQCDHIYRQIYLHTRCVTTALRHRWYHDVYNVQSHWLERPVLTSLWITCRRVTRCCWCNYEPHFSSIDSFRLGIRYVNTDTNVYTKRTFRCFTYNVTCKLDKITFIFVSHHFASLCLHKTNTYTYDTISYTKYIAQPHGL